MAFSDWVSEIRTNVSQDCLQSGPDKGGIKFYHGLLRRRVGHRAGTNVYERDWDLLVVLDACRSDLMAEVAPAFPFLDSPDTHDSTASCSRGWFRTTFDADSAAVARTAYVTGNPFTESHVRAEQFAVLDEVWRYAWDDERGTIPARPITDRAIAVGREHDPERMIVHYMQPHFPSIPTPLSDGMQVEEWGDEWETPFELLQRGELTREEVWNSYRDNLEYVLDDVAVLLDNVDAESVVITADHGNAFGEFGIYAHPELIPLACLREVPWYRTTATDDGSYEPKIEPTERERPDVESKLRSLGYL